MAKKSPKPKVGSPKSQPKAPGSKPGPIFRRFITLPNGKVLDAHDYGHRAWPIGG